MAIECQKSSDNLKNCVIEPSKNQDNFKLDGKGGIVKSKCRELVNVNVVNRCITELPPVLISEILNCLEPKELGIVSCVSRLLYRLASEHHVWKELYCERWGAPFGAEDEKSWKELFMEREFRSRTFMGRYSIDTLYGHTEAVRAVFVLSSKKLVFTSGYDQIVRMWDLEEGSSIASSRPLGCTIRAVAADSRLLVAGGTDGFIHGWRANDGNPHLFDLKAPQNRNMEFRVWEHQGPITCLALDFNRMYSGSWDTSIRIWDRSSLECLKVLMHDDWVWSLASHDTTVVSAAGSDLYVWDTNCGSRLAIVNNAHAGYTYSLVRSHTGKLLFTGGEDGSICMFEILGNAKSHVSRVATWTPHSSAVNSLAFEFPWLVSASSDGKLSLIDVRKLLRTNRKAALNNNSSKADNQVDNVEPPQRMLHGFGNNLFAVDVGPNRIVCAGEGGVVWIWNFSEALEYEHRVRALRGLRLDNRVRRRKLQSEMNGKGRRGDECSFAAKKNQINGDRNRRKMIWKDDLETFGDIGSLEDNVESFLLNDGGDGNIYGTLKQTLTEHKPESSKGFSFGEVGCIRTRNKVTCCHFLSDGKLLTSAGHDKKGGYFSLKRVKVEQEVDHSIDGETQSEERITIAHKQDMTFMSKGSTASTLIVEELSKEMNEMKIKDEKSDDYEDDIKDMEPAVVSGNGTETGQIIVTTLTGRNGQKKQTLCYMAERVVGTGSFGVVFQAKGLETGESVAIKKVLQDRRYKNRELQIMRMLDHPNVVRLRHCFYSSTEKNEVYLNLVLEYVSETVYRVSRHYSRVNHHWPIIYVQLYTYQLCRALNYMHNVIGVCHRDIKPQS